MIAASLLLARQQHTTPVTHYIRQLGASSAKYGLCEVCGGYVSDVCMRSDGVNDQVLGHSDCLTKCPSVQIIHVFGNAYTTHVVEEIEIDGERGYFQVRDSATRKLMLSSDGTGPACFISLRLAQQCARWAGKCAL